MTKRTQSSQRQYGLSLLELIVAVTVMAMAMGMLYRASGGSARSAEDLRNYQRAILLAKSLLATRDAVPEEGWNEAGQSAGYLWTVRSRPYAVMPEDTRSRQLHELEIQITWLERGQDKHLALTTLRPQRLPGAWQKAGG